MDFRWIVRIGLEWLTGVIDGSRIASGKMPIFTRNATSSTFVGAVAGSFIGTHICNAINARAEQDRFNIEFAMVCFSLTTRQRELFLGLGVYWVGKSWIYRMERF